MTPINRTEINSDRNVSCAVYYAEASYPRPSVNHTYPHPPPSDSLSRFGAHVDGITLRCAPRWEANSAIANYPTDDAGWFAWPWSQPIRQLPTRVETNTAGEARASRNRYAE